MADTGGSKQELQRHARTATSPIRADHLTLSPVSSILLIKVPGIGKEATKRRWLRKSTAASQLVGKFLTLRPDNVSICSGFLR